MSVEVIAEIRDFKQKFPSVRLLTVKRVLPPNSFYVIIYNLGSCEVYVYNLARCKSKNLISAPLRNIPTETAADEHLPPDWEFSFVTSIPTAFPIYFVVYIHKKIWAFGQFASLNLNEILHQNEPKCDSQDDWAVLHISQKSVQTAHKPSINTLQISSKVPKKKLCTMKHIPICSVSSCVADCLLVCRKDISSKCWSVEVFTEDQKYIQFATVPFPNDYILQQISKLQFGSSGTYFPNLDSVITCIGLEGNAELETKEILTEQSFVTFFGSEALSSSSAVILFGVPDGRVLWCLLPVKSFFYMDEKTIKFNVLCDIEQPIHALHVFSHNNSNSGDSLAVIGSLGKVLILSSSGKDGKFVHQNIQTFMLYVSPPVCSYSMVNSMIYHVSTDGQLWISSLDRALSSSQATKIEYTSQMTDFKNISAVCEVIAHESLLFCVTFDGLLLFGTFKENSEVAPVTTDQIPFLIGACYEQSSHLHMLQCINQNLTLLFAQVSLAISISKGQLPLNAVTASVTKIDDSFSVEVTFDFLKTLNLHPDYWHLHVSVSRCFQQQSPCVQRTVPFNPSDPKLSLIIDEPFSLFTSCTSLPWYVEAGIMLGLPEGQEGDCWKSFGMNFPIYLQMKTMVIHALDLYTADEEQDQFANATNSKHTTDVFLAIEEISQAKQLIKKDVPEAKLNSNMFPTEFFFRLSLETAYKGLEHCKENEYHNFLQMLLNNSNKIDSSQKLSITCFGHPIAISMCKKGSHLCISVSTDCFKFLVSLKLAILSILMCADGRYETSSKCICIASNVLENVEQLSRGVINYLCDDEEEKSENLIVDILNLYQLIRRNISNKLSFYKIE